MPVTTEAEGRAFTNTKLVAYSYRRWSTPAQNDGTSLARQPLTHLVEPMVLVVVRGMTERRSAEETNTPDQARLAAIVTSSADAIIGETLDGTVTNSNEAAECRFGHPAGEMIGQSIRRLVPVNYQAEEDIILRPQREYALSRRRAPPRMDLRCVGHFNSRVQSSLDTIFALTP